MDKNGKMPITSTLVGIFLCIHSIVFVVVNPSGILYEYVLYVLYSRHFRIHPASLAFLALWALSLVFGTVTAVVRIPTRS